MKRIIIVHSWDGSSKDDWMPWVTAELKKKGYEVLCPDMPHTEKPIIEEWIPFLSDIVGSPNKDTYFIGHSIGCQAIMRYLETVNVKVGGALFVAGWFDLENLEDSVAEEIARPWIEMPLNTAKIKNNLGFSVVILGDNDPWVPYEKTKGKFEQFFDSQIVTISGAGHITSDDGYDSFEQLIALVHAKISDTKKEMVG